MGEAPRNQTRDGVAGPGVRLTRTSGLWSSPSMLSPHLWLAWALSPKSASRRRPPVAGGARYHVEVGVDAAVHVHVQQPARVRPPDPRRALDLVALTHRGPDLVAVADRVRRVVVGGEDVDQLGRVLLPEPLVVLVGPEPVLPPAQRSPAG